MDRLLSEFSINELLNNIQMKKLHELDILGVSIPRENCAKLPTYFGYISYKAADYLVKPSNIYKRDDYFNYPLDEWDDEKLKLGCEKIIYNCSGISEDNCFTDLSINEIKNTFELFHFSFLNIEIINREKNIFKLEFIHKMEGVKSITYCMDNNYQNEIQYLNVPTRNKYTKISVDNEHKIVKILSDNKRLGVETEYSYLRMLYKNIGIQTQELSKITINNEDKWIDIIYFASENKQYEQIFDISEFFC